MLSITEGHQLALHYSVFATAKDSVPTLAAQDVFLVRLSQVLSSWDQSNRHATGPSKIVFLLKNKYTLDRLTAKDLTGVDARTVSLVNAVANRHSCRLALATVVCTEMGLGLIGHRRDWVDEDWLSEKENIEGFDDLMDIETDLKLQHLVHLNGQPICDSVEFDVETEAIPADLETLMRFGEPDKRIIGFVCIKADPCCSRVSIAYTVSRRSMPMSYA